MSDQLCNLPIKQLRRCPLQLRPVRKETVEYYMLRDSIRDVGIIQPILVRPATEGYEVVCGNHRFECASDLQLEEAPCVVRNITDQEVLRLQVIENANQIETTSIDYIRRLQQIVNTGQMDIDELAFCVHKHPDRVRDLLSLNCLSPKAKELVDTRRLSMAIGIQMAKLALPDQDALLDLHGTIPDREFLEIVRAGVRDNRDAYKAVKQQTNQPIRPYLRKQRTYEDELENSTHAATVLTRCEASTPLDGWKAAIKWALCLDDESVAERVGRQERLKNLEAKRSNLRNIEMKERRNEQSTNYDD